jgi:hypothetical protein
MKKGKLVSFFSLSPSFFDLSHDFSDFRSPPPFFKKINKLSRSVFIDIIIHDPDMRATKSWQTLWFAETPGKISKADAVILIFQLLKLKLHT